jgi:hypothetical protein
VATTCFEKIKSRVQPEFFVGRNSIGKVAYGVCLRHQRLAKKRAFIRANVRVSPKRNRLAVCH